MIVAKYCTEGVAYGDSESEKVVENWIRNNDGDAEMIYEVSTNSTLYCLLVAIAEKQIASEQALIEYDGERLRIAENGQLYEHRVGLFDSQFQRTKRLLAAMSK